MNERTPDMETDLRGRVVTLEHASASKEQRITALETWQRQRDIDSARHDERWKSMDERFARVESALESVNGTLTWINRLIIGGIVTGVMVFLIQGGFTPP